MTSRSNPSATPQAAASPQRRDEILVDRIALADRCAPSPPSRRQPPPLLAGVGQFTKTVGELDAADIELEAFRQPRIGGLRPRQRRHHARIFVQDGRPAVAEMRLDLLHQHAAENVAPSVFFRDVDAGIAGHDRETPAVGPSRGSASIRSMPAKRSKASTTVMRSGSAKGSAVRSRKANCRRRWSVRRRPRPPCSLPSAVRTGRAPGTIPAW